MAHCYPNVGQTNYHKETYETSYADKIHTDNHHHGNGYGHNHGSAGYFNHGTQPYGHNSTNGYGHNHGGITQHGHFNHGTKPYGHQNEHSVIKTHTESFSHGVGTHKKHSTSHGSTKTHSSTTGIKNIFRRKKRDDGCSDSSGSDSD